MNAKNTNRKSKRGCRRFTQNGADEAEQLANSNWRLAKVKIGDLTAKDAKGAKGAKGKEVRSVKSSRKTVQAMPKIYR